MDNAKVILALTALGYDPEKIAGHNLIKGLNNYEFIERNGLIGVMYALIALNSGNYTPPANPDPGKIVTREVLRDTIVNHSNLNGGWHEPGYDDVDITALALQALAPFYHKGIKKVDDEIDKAKNWLSGQKNSNGGYTVDEGGSKVDSCEATAKVITALTAIGVNPDTDWTFIYSDNSAIDSLLRFTVSEGGFKHKPSDTAVDTKATEEGFCALAAYNRYLQAKNSLLDMTDVKRKTNPARPVDVKSIKFTKASYTIKFDNKKAAYTNSPLELGKVLKITPTKGKAIKAKGSKVKQTWTTDKAGKKLINLDKNTGKVTPKANADGKVKVKVKVKDFRNRTLTKTCEIIIKGPIKIKNVRVTGNNRKNGIIEIGDTVKLTSKVSPDNASVKALNWKAEKKGYVKLTPSKDGKSCTVKGLKTGKLKIYGEAKDGSKKKDYYTVTINPKSVTSVKINGKSNIKMKVGETKKLTAKVLPKDASVTSVKWESRTESVATVGKNGLVTAKKKGRTIITVTTKGKNSRGRALTDKITVTVE